MYHYRSQQRQAKSGSFRPRSRMARFQPKNNHRLIETIEQFIANTNQTKVEVAVPVITIKHQFSDFDLAEVVQANIIGAGYQQPTPIQDQVIPFILDNADVIGQAQTGTGKTAAFLLPLITKLLRNQLHRVLIMAPTRELAIQIEADLRVFAKNSGLAGVMCIGGTSVRQQIVSLKQEFQFLIGTPGRIKDMSEQRMIDWSGFDGLVLDEVDRMLDMGFIHDVRDILFRLSPARQSLFFSATLPKEVERLCHSFSRTPVLINIPAAEETYPIAQQIISVSAGQRKLEVLYDLLCRQEEFKKVIIFGRTKHGVKRLAEELDKRGFAADSIHGNKSQAARQRSLGLFKNDQISVLVATDVAARGIDVADVTHVINYDLPETFEDYIHRIGRTGRAGNQGTALTLIDSHD